MSDLENHLKPYSRAVVRLLKSPIDRNSTVWQDVLFYEEQIQDYVALLGLELIVKKDEGFAFLKQFEDSDGDTLGLITRRQIGFETSIVLVVIRQCLEDFDSNPIQVLASEKFMTNTEIREEVELFLPEKFNRVKFVKELDNYIRKIVELGYLKETKRKENEPTYQIQRIIKEKVTLTILDEFKTQLQSYVQSL